MSVKLVECRKCKSTFRNQSILRQHLASEHPDFRHFECSYHIHGVPCQAAYKYKKNLLQHQNQVEHDEKQIPAPTPRGRPSKSILDHSKQEEEDKGEHKLKHKCLFEDPSGLTKYLCDAMNFEQWLDSYQQKRRAQDRPLADSTKLEIMATIKRLEEQGLLTLDVFDSDVEATMLQFQKWFAEQRESKSLSPTTISTYYRHCWWYARYRASVLPTFPWSLAKWLDEQARHQSHDATHQAACQASITWLDPYHMLCLRNQLVEQLVIQQRTFIHPLMKRVSSVNHDNSKDLSEQITNNDIHQYRCWLELAIRLLNIPHRVQATKYLIWCEDPVTPLTLSSSTDQQSDFVVKLILKEDLLFYRLFAYDKVGQNGSHKPVEVAMDSNLTTYVWFYLRYLRPYCNLKVVDHDYFYVNSNGGVWETASADLKAYLKDVLHTDPKKFDPSGRFVHGIRHLVLSTYAYKIGFDTAKLRRMALLTRHSLATMTLYYNIWEQWQQAQQAAVEFQHVMSNGHNHVNSESNWSVFRAQVETPLAVLDQVPTSIFQLLEQERKDYLNRRAYKPLLICNPLYRDQSTQTEWTSPISNEVKKESISNKIPSCPVCRKELQVQSNPCMDSTSSKYRMYYALCPRKCNKTKYWMPLGYHPTWKRNLNQSSTDLIGMFGSVERSIGSDGMIEGELV